MDWMLVIAAVGTGIAVLGVINTAGWFVLNAVFVRKADLPRFLAPVHEELHQLKVQRDDWIKRHEDLHRGMAEQMHRLAERLSNLPTTRELAEARVEIAKVTGEVAKFERLLQQVQGPLQLLIQYHLHHETGRLVPPGAAGGDDGEL